MSNFAGFAVSLTLRVLGGEALLGWPAAVAYPWYDAETNKQYYPYKTIAMLSGFVVMVVVSRCTHWLMCSGKLDTKWLRRINNRLSERKEKGDNTASGLNNFSHSNDDNIMVYDVNLANELYLNKSPEVTTL